MRKARARRAHPHNYQPVEPAPRFDTLRRCAYCGSKGQHERGCDNPALAIRGQRMECRCGAGIFFDPEPPVDIGAAHVYADIRGTGLRSNR